MQADPALVDIPVVVVTTVESPVGPDGCEMPYIRKPFSTNEVKRTILAALGDQGRVD